MSYYSHPEIVCKDGRSATVTAVNPAGMERCISGGPFIGDEHASAYQHADFFMQRWEAGEL